MSTSVDVDVYAHDRSASRTFDQVGNAASRSGHKVSGFGKIAAGVFTGTALWNGAERLTRLMVDLGEGAAEDERSTRMLALQYHNSAHATDAQVAATEDWITAQGKVLGIADDDLRPALTKLVAVTHDVGDAQRDTAVALDAAAGTGKDFQSVVDAMVKAEAGSVGGLGRLGIATKDVDGKTKSLNAIVRDMATTFKGQAAEAADTASGRFQRMHVQFSELGETIGYWMIPKATALGEVMLDDVVPAAEQTVHWLGDELGPIAKDIGGWFSDNRDDIRDFAKVVGEDVVGGLETIVEIGGNVIDFLDGLPGPVKSLAIEGALAAIVLPQVAGGIAAAGSAAGAAKGQVAGFVTGLQDAERRAGLLSRGLINVAGIGGMVALEEGARTGNKGLTVLGSGLTGAAGGAMLGSAVFPGVGTAIGAAGGFAAGAGISMWKFSHGTDAARDSAKDAKPDFDSLKATLDQVTGATTAATKSMILQKLQEDGIAAAARQQGIATSDLIKASLGNKKAIERVNDAWKVQDGILAGLQNQKVSEWLLGMRTEMGKAKKDVQDANAALNGTDRAAKQAGGALAEVGTKRPQTDKWTALLIGDLNKAVGRTHSTSDDMRRTLATEPGKAKANLNPYANSLYGNLDGIAGQAYRRSIGIGTQIQSGVMSGLTGLGGAIFGAVQQAIANGLAAAHSGGSGGGGGGGGKGGGSRRSPRTTTPRSLADIVGDRLRGGSGGSWAGLGANQLSDAGADLLASLVKGIEKGRKPLDKVLNAIKKDIEDKISARDRLQGLRDELAGGFAGFQESVFGVQSTDQGPVTIEQLLAKAASEKAKAAQVDQDVQKLLGAGVSEDLIRQLQSQGSQGVEALHALAGANADQLKQIVADNAAAQASYVHAGQAAGDKFYGQAIAQLNAQIAIAQGVEKVVQGVADLADRIGKVEFILHGSDLVAALVKEKKKKGKQ